MRRNSYIFTLAFVGMLAAFGPFVTDFYLPALPALSEYFATSGSMVQLSLTVSMIGLGLGQLVVGPLSDRYGRRLPLLVSLAAFVAATAGCLTTDSIARFLVYRFIQGLAGAGQSEGRTAGATAVFEATENIELVASIPCDWDATKAYDTTKDILTAHPDLKGIFACNDVMALAAVEALAAEGRTDVLVYGVDFTADAREALKAGTMTGTMSYSSVKYTEAALKLAVAIAQGKEYAEPIYLPLTLVTKENVAELDNWA